MIGVIVFKRDTMEKLDEGWADNPADAIYAGQVMYDEVLKGVYGERYSVGFYIDGRLVQLVNGRPVNSEEIFA